MSDLDPAGDWREIVNVLVARLQDLELPELGEERLDLTPSSLDALEGALLDIVGPGADVSFDETTPTGSATAYLGEVLARAGGGGWRWEEPRGLPAVVSDPALGLRVVPSDVVAQALRERTGAVLDAEARRWRESAERYARDHAGWTPAKEHTPGLDRVAAEPPAPGSVLERWLDEGARLFARDLGGPGAPPWDFGLASLDAVEEEVFERVGTVDALPAPEHAELVHRAHWYAGEVIRHNLGGTWVFHPDVPRPAFPGGPYLVGIGPRDNADSPYAMFRVALRSGQRHTVRRRVEGLA